MLLGNLHEMRNFALRTKWALVDMAHDIEIPTYAEYAYTTATSFQLKVLLVQRWRKLC